MLSAFPALRRMQECRQKLCILVICSILGSILGAAFAINADHTYFLLMRSAPSVSVSIVGSVLRALPFLVFSYLIIHSKPLLVYLICGVSLFMLTSALWAIRAAFGSAGWLIFFLLQFPALIYTPFLLYLSVCRMMGQYGQMQMKYAMIIIAIIGMIDYAFISPFLAEVMASYETMGRYAIHVGLDRCL